ncbi:MAG TPA: hypothetical protein VKP08_01190 [Anaerolineales bacterium]|nr:hypothetical protein [Anaerolineales bacterium]
MTKPADLTAYLFDEQMHPLLGELAQWMEASARFTLFVETYRDKIRKKVRLARELETALDLRGELIVPYALLNDRRLDVAYEPYASAKRRGPDFAVTYRTNLTFNIEVARMRAEESSDDRFLRLLLYKLGQMQPGMSNLLIIHNRGTLNLERFMQDVKLKAEKKDAAFYEVSRYPNPAAFYKDFLRLSAILLWTRETQLWINKQAKPSLEEKILRLVSSLISSTIGIKGE